MKATAALLALTSSILLLTATMPAVTTAQEACTRPVACIQPPTVTGGLGGSLVGPNIAVQPPPEGDFGGIDILGPDIIGYGDPDDFVMTPPTITPR